MAKKRPTFRPANEPIPATPITSATAVTAVLEKTEETPTTQLGTNDEWLRQALADVNVDIQKRDFFEQWTNQATDNGPSESNKALTWFMNGDFDQTHRWFEALNDKPESLVYDIFTPEETQGDSFDFTDVTIEAAVKQIIEEHKKFLVWEEESYFQKSESQEMEESMNDSQPEQTNDTTTGGGDVDLSVEQTTNSGDSSVETSEDDSTSESPAFNYAGFRETYELPDTWTDDNIDQWIAVGANVDTFKTAAGNFIIDPTRKDRPIATWTLSEILDGFAGNLDNIGESQYADLAKAYRQLEAVDAAWSIRDLIDYLTQGLLPPKTSNGAWRNDVTRARRPATDWTTQELIAWALGELRAVGEATDVKIAIELNQRLGLCSQSNKPEDVIRAYRKTQNTASTTLVGEQPTATTPEPTVAETTAAPVTTIPQGLTAMNVGYLKTQTERYLKACAPGTPITPEIGAKEQKELDNLFRYILKLEDPQGFGAAMTYFRDFYAKNRDGLFEPTYATRFTGTLRTDGDLQETHVNLLSIFHVYTDPDKAARKQMDLPYLLRKFPATRQAWLLEFFQRYC